MMQMKQVFDFSQWIFFDFFCQVVVFKFQFVGDDYCDYIVGVGQVSGVDFFLCIDNGGVG